MTELPKHFPRLATLSASTREEELTNPELPKHFHRLATPSTSTRGEELTDPELLKYFGCPAATSAPTRGEELTDPELLKYFTCHTAPSISAVEEVKITKLQAATITATRDTRMLYEGKQLDDTWTVGESGMTSGSRLIELGRLRGGAATGNSSEGGWMMENYADFDYATDSGSDSDVEEANGEEEVVANFQVDENPTIGWVDSKKKRPILIYNGRVQLVFDSHKRSIGALGFTFYHYFDNKDQTVSVFRCSEFPNNCSVKVWMQDGVYVKHKGAHNHFADPIDIGHRLVVQKAKEELRANPLVKSSLTVLLN